MFFYVILFWFATWTANFNKHIIFNKRVFQLSVISYQLIFQLSTNLSTII